MDLKQWIPAILSLVLAVIPVVIWIRLLPKEGESRGLYVKTFLVGTLSVVPPFILIFVFDRWPQLNIYSAIQRGIEAAVLASILTNIVVGIVEEIAKHMIVRVIDKRHPEYIQTIGTALKLSICAGLGFSFAENIFYFYNVWINPQFGVQDLFSTFIFRSIFTMCGHMVFSGIFGYFFGMGKFAADVTEEARWEGKKLRFAHFFSRISGRMTFEVIREMKTLTGLCIAIAMHASFDVVLDLGYKLPAILIVVAGAGYIFYLMKSKTGHLLFSFTRRRESSMATKDEEVVLELLGMWLKQGRLKEVVEICDRLSARDPDNNVVKLFRAKASDNENLKNLYGSMKKLFGKSAVPVSSRAQGGSANGAAVLGTDQEKVVVEVMDQWFRAGNYKQVLEIANRLLEKNPNSQGAKLLVQKALDKEKMKEVFEGLKKIFE